MSARLPRATPITPYMSHEPCGLGAYASARMREAAFRFLSFIQSLVNQAGAPCAIGAKPATQNAPSKTLIKKASAVTMPTDAKNWF